MSNLNHAATLMSEEDIFDFILDFQRAFPGVSPSYREIMSALGISSTGTVRNKMQGLIDSGQLEVYREYAGFRGLLIPGTVMVTKQDALSAGVSAESWERLVEIREKVNREVKAHLKGMNGNGA